MLLLFTYGIRSSLAVSPERKKQLEAESGIMVFAIVLTMFAVLTSAAAFYAWFPEYGRSFSGGITGSIRESRIAWAIAAAVFNAIVIPLWAYVAYTLIGQFLAKRKTHGRG